MLLTITYSGYQTQDLGYLLYKNPEHPQSIELSRGYAHIFFPEISEERTTATLLLDMEPLGYEVRWETFLADEKFPEWKESDYVNLVISRRRVLSDILKQLCVFIPAFGRQKHYFVTEQ
ncbi:MAG: hypothetical protein IJ733_02760 [Lachnospiraceae bacterium]|nr:hypothetical protein [Lachnospiraceae bacterium]